MHRLLLLGLAVAIGWAFSPEKPKFHKVPALPGDGVYSLLRRYHLERHSCNHEQFYKLNGLKRNAALKVGRYYALPILLYRFNGKTIRSSIGIDDWDLAKRIENYNEAMAAEGLRAHSFRDDNILWVPYHELNCPEPDLALPESPLPAAGEASHPTPASSKGRIFPIFGPRYQHVPLASTRLRGKVFYIVSGHGGPDPGAIGRARGHQLCEDEYAYDVALRLCRKLVAYGATAYMITRDPDDGIRSGKFLPCDNDEIIWGAEAIPVSQKPRLEQRSETINDLFEKHRRQGVQEQMALVIHVDSRSKREQIDLFFYYQESNERSLAVARQLHQTMRRKYKRHRSNGQYHGTVSARDLHMLRETLPPTVYIELGNIRHPRDQQRIILESNREALANWLFEGIIAATAR